MPLSSTVSHVLRILAVGVSAVQCARVQASGKDLTQSPLVDVTPLFAGREEMAFQAGIKGMLSCCCKVGVRKCHLKFHAAKAKESCEHVPYSSQYRASLRQRCFIAASENPGFAQRVNGPMKTYEGVIVHPKIASQLPSRSFPAQPVQLIAKVYMVRHGQSTFNLLTKEHTGVKDYLMGKLKDAQLTPKGQDQAVASQEFFRKQLDNVEVESIQLAASLLSRAYDTLLLATCNVWTKWHSTDYIVDQVPAFMERGKASDIKRHSQLLDSAPVRWEDSSLSHSELISDALKPQFNKHFEKNGDRDWLTADPWQVQAAYPRRDTSTNCNKHVEQFDDVILYLKNLISSGKTHVVIGAHGGLIRCFLRHAKKVGTIEQENGLGEKHIQAVWKDGSNEISNVHEEKLKNAEVLSFDFQISPSTTQPSIRNIGLQSPAKGFPHIGRLVVKVTRGRNLKNKDTFSISDPYVVLDFGGLEPSKSLTIQENLNPVWNFTSVLQVASAMQVIRISVFDEDVTSDDFLGNAIVHIGDVIKQEATSTVRVWVGLLNIPHGEVEVEMRYHAYTPRDISVD